MLRRAVGHDPTPSAKSLRWDARAPQRCGYHGVVTPRDRLIVAIDRSDRKDILTLADNLHEVVSFLKIGLEAYVANGPDLIQELIRAGYRIFLDLKFHDIPNTAAGAVRSAAGLGAALLTVHASGGPDML